MQNVLEWIKSKVNPLLIKLGIKSAPVCKKKTCCKTKKK